MKLSKKARTLFSYLLAVGGTVLESDCDRDALDELTQASLVARFRGHVTARAVKP